jgi:hypothetical protein
MHKENAWRDSTTFIEGKMDEVALAVEDYIPEGLIPSIRSRETPVVVVWQKLRIIFHKSG